MGRPPLERVEELFHRAADLEPRDRAVLLDTECGGDPELRTAVEELLEHDDPFERTDAFIVSPVERAGQEPAGTLPGWTDPAVLPRPGPPGYELLEVLGQGGMGVVFRARQLSLDRPVALKMLSASTPVSAEQLVRFRAEADALARVQHPNVVQIYEVGECDGHPYLVMEYVAGPTLAHEVKGRPQPPRRAAELVRLLAGAVQAVHDCSIIHRDLKPANILLAHRTRESAIDSEALVRFTPKIADFGLAKRLAASSQTRTGAVWGTPSYMAPEQAGGRADLLGPATDIYALGAILYEILTGRPPFEGATVEETVSQVLAAEPISPAQLRPALPRDLVTIALKCLEKEPRRRYARAAELADELRRFLEGRPIRARPLGVAGRLWRWCRRRPLVAALTATSSLLAVALVTTVVVYESLLLEQTEHQLQSTQEEAAEQGSVAEEERGHLTARDHVLASEEEERGDVLAALLWLTDALRRDADHRDQEQRDRLAIARALRHCPQLLGFRIYDRQIVGGGQTASGCWLATVEDDRTLTVREILRGEVRKLHGVAGDDAAADKALTVALSPDSRLLAVTQGGGAEAHATRVWDLQTEKPRTPSLRHGAPVVGVRFSDDNNLLSVRLANHTEQLWDLRAGQRIVLEGTPHGPARHVRPSGNGEGLFTLWADGVAQERRLADGKLSDRVETARQTNRSVALAAWGSDGQLALVDADNRLWLWDIHTGKERLLAPSHGTEGRPGHLAWSPDGRLLLTADHLDRVRVWDAAAGRPVTPLLSHPRSLRWAGFAGKDKLVTVDAHPSVRLWQLSDGQDKVSGSDSRSVADLSSLAEILAGRRIDPDGRLVPLTAEDLGAAWKKLHAAEEE
jgi:serine/threonine protein kinase